MKQIKTGSSVMHHVLCQPSDNITDTRNTIPTSHGCYILWWNSGCQYLMVMLVLIIIHSCQSLKPLKWKPDLLIISPTVKVRPLPPPKAPPPSLLSHSFVSLSFSLSLPFNQPCSDVASRIIVDCFLSFESFVGVEEDLMSHCLAFVV